jgi:SpoVK/Ycf46/Vps4 family AAA+-type ATPase
MNLKERNLQFSEELIETIINQTDGYVFKDLEKIIDKIILESWNNENIENRKIELEESINQLLYNYVCINMSETKFYKSTAQINWKLIGGLENAKKSLAESLIWPIKYKTLYKKLGMKFSKFSKF